MLDNEFRIAKDVQASLVSLICPSLSQHSTNEETTQSIQELRELMSTLGVATGNEYIQNKKTIDPATILGSGKLIEIAEQAKEEGSKLLVFDVELTASQIRNIKKITSLDIVDRCHVILEIFAEHARTRESKIQIEIARLQYLLPRLAGFWSHLSRQRGGIGVRGGEGEQQIELDRRLIRQRIEYYKKELEHVAQSRHEQRKNRKSKVITAALVGYTNAGKSSLMNRLCKVDLLAEDKLFATLDSTYRTLNPDTKPPMVLIDTVGFISNLPNTLIDGFKTTLESTIEADLLIIVCDISSPHFEKHLEVTQSVLKELGVEEKEQMIVFNKSDQLGDILKQKIIKRTHPHSFVISAFNEEDVKALREHIVNFFLEKQESYDLFVPYGDGKAHSKITGQTNIIGQEHHEQGVFYRIKIPSFIFDSLKLHQYQLGPENPLESYL